LAAAAAISSSAIAPFWLLVNIEHMFLLGSDGCDRRVARRIVGSRLMGAESDSSSGDLPAGGQPGITPDVVRSYRFYSLGEGADNGIYYDAHPIEHMRHHLTMLAYDMNDARLPYGHGAPLRLRNEIELGFKQVKWIRGIEFVAHYSEIGGGYGGYNQDHEFFGYRQSI